MSYNRKPYITESAGWDARKEYCQFIIEKIRDLFMFSEEGQQMQYEKCFKNLLSVTYPYIAKHIIKEKVDFSFNDVQEQLSKLKPDNSDFNQSHNNNIYSVISEIMYQKQMTLFRYLAMEKLLMPIYTPTKPGDEIYDM